MVWKSSPTGVWRTSKTHFSGLFFRPSKRGSSGGAGRLFLYLKKAKTTVFLGLKTTHYYLFHFLGYGYPPTPPGGANGGGPFWPGVVGSSLCFGPPPPPGGYPPRPPFWGYPDLRSPLLPDQIWRCSHRSSVRYNYFQPFQVYSFQTEYALRLSCVKVMGFRLRRDVALIRGSNNVICSNACSRICVAAI